MGFFDLVLVGPMKFFLSSFYKLTEILGFPSYGLAIIIFTIVLKFVLYPLTVKQIEGMKKMQDLQPKMKAIQDRYKDNKEIRVEVTPEKILLNKNSDGTNKYEKYDYLLSDKLSTEKAIQKFIKEDLNKDISEEKIKTIITEDDTIS